MPESENTREKIKAAALDVFVERGYDGARMQEIADRAGANKAMIYYYFSSKDSLFEAILHDTFSSLFRMFAEIFNVTELDPKKLIPQVVHIHLQFLKENKHLPRLISREIHSGNPVVERLVLQYFSQYGRDFFNEVNQKFRAASAKGLLRRVDPRQTIWNFVAMNLFTFVMQPVLSAAWPEDFKHEEEFLKERERAIVDLLLNGLLPR